MSTTAASASLLPPGTRVCRAREVLWRDGAFGVVLLTPHSRDPLTLSGTGRALWVSLARPATVAELADDLAAVFDTEPEQVRADIAPVLEELVRMGALEARP